MQNPLRCNTKAAFWRLGRSDYIPKEPFTHPWERFDFIVIDEVHSILSDANYQSAPFYIQSLLEEIKLRAPKCKVIVMTGSPEIIRDYPLFEDYHLIDRMDVCDNLTPKSVKFISKKKAQNILRQCITDNKKAVYFCNRIDDIVKTAVKLSLDTHACIAPSFSNEDKRRKLKKEHLGLFNAMENAETTLATQCMLPENIILFLTNARNKEGINIKNADIKTMLVDAHAEVDIKQMAGRVRNLLDELYIVVDATSFDDNDLAGELGFSQNSELLGTVNSYLKKLAEDVKYTFGPHDNINHKQILQDYVSFIHEKFPYLRYNYFKNTFVFYMQRQISKEYYDTQNELFSTHLTSQGFKELSQNWFPDALCVVEFYTDEKNQAIVDQYIEDHNLLDKRLHRKDEQVILMHLSKLTNTEYKKLGNLLRRYGYIKKPRGKNAIGDWIIVHK